MDLKTILIVALVAFMVFWYNNPIKATEYLDEGIEKTQSLLGGMTMTCPDNYDPVCAEGVTYDNSCVAQKAGYNDMTIGACE